MLLYQGIWRKYIFARASAISHDGAKWKIHLLYFCLSEVFRMTVRKFRMVMWNHFSHFPCVLQPSLLCFISHGHAKLKNMLFRLLFAISPISSFLIHLHHLQLSSKAWSKCISSSSLSTLCTLFHSIFPFVTPCFKNHLKISPKLNKEPLVSLARVAMYYLGILGIINTQKVWNSWKLVSKMCGFWVVINSSSYW